MESSKGWSSGQVIRQVPWLSRQQLYLYSLMGLLRDSERPGPNGRRLYGRDIFPRLDRIAELRRHGKTLQQIRRELTAARSPRDGDGCREHC